MGKMTSKLDDVVNRIDALIGNHRKSKK
jgi:hypothetical protein